MSYSFNARAASKELAKAAVRAKFAEVIQGQACHQRDQSAALAAADAQIDLLADDESKDVVVSMNGWLSGQWTGSDVTRIEGASVSVSASLASPEQDAA